MTASRVRSWDSWVRDTFIIRASTAARISAVVFQFSVRLLLISSTRRSRPLLRARALNTLGALIQLLRDLLQGLTLRQGDIVSRLRA